MQQYKTLREEWRTKYEQSLSDMSTTTTSTLIDGNNNNGNHAPTPRDAQAAERLRKYQCVFSSLSLSLSLSPLLLLMF
jgi:hypothetical protein